MPHRLARRPLVPAILGVTDLTLGIVLIVEPAGRVSADSFHAAKQVMPLPVWGVILLVLAIATCIRCAINKHPGYALSLAGGWHTFFAVSLIGSAIQIHTAGLIGIVTYTSLVILHLLAAWRKIR